MLASDPVNAPRNFYDIGLSALGRRISYGRNIYDEEWDVLIILDACRYDLFEEFAPRHDVYERFESVVPIYSCASATPEWLVKTFDRGPDELVSGTFYISSTGFVTEIDATRLYGIEEVWSYAVDPEYGVTRPGAVTNAAIKSYRETDADRYVIHYVQPHAPFLHCPGKYDSVGNGGEGGTQNVWRGLQEGRYERDEIWQDYGQNLLGVLDEVETVIRNVEGTVVVTSDHGNAMGEWFVYGHPKHNPVPAVKRVPWVLAEGAGRDDFEVREPEHVATGLGEQDLGEHLRALGYRS
ncbi:LTA synthase family protein [Salinirubellus salinus]|uniref:LTA synthase family protein n=1 Tax=Salinirubellus salinus TaxID=1364945 RepID=A0A9E7R249_9EURY|nr:LTA synthase family protein [Salinirubellus salinus]UWM54365.1 LTA synthase family protein [Salinirubellus salinus]